jgi:hypothetical protein
MTNISPHPLSFPGRNVGKKKDVKMLYFNIMAKVLSL